ncbi:uncharacterized protein KD926_004392 [Aspergillus affinis]|uniref:uncharacterized protein n=1 Tax=Aspergillus affinis TaxID=1070780 RepID=UPI0022FEBFB5|nr:uncharacterized protein KD926_004392 [Aspergillus affinis]KAI9043208.1 hypothetical protein KD926_004392 [Aspergillus affinis]
MAPVAKDDEKMAKGKEEKKPLEGLAEGVKWPDSGKNLSFSTDHQELPAENQTVYVGQEFSAIDLQAPTRPSTVDYKTQFQQSKQIIVEYLLDKAPEFRKLSELRERGWNDPAGDQFFQTQRQRADNADKTQRWRFYNMMKEIGEYMHQVTGALRIPSSPSDTPRILDMCMAPGGFLATALKINPESQALAFSLPISQKGHDVLLPKDPRVILKFLDITMLAADMGLVDIPFDHPDGPNFLSRQLGPELFDLIFCDGHVLRNHDRAAYREHTEATRLTLTQLALGLEHLRPGGTMIVLLHKIEALHNVQLLYTFSKFSTVRLFKHPKIHGKRSSFYMIATDIKSHGIDAAKAIERWKRIWRVATTGTLNMYYKALCEDNYDMNEILHDFGSELVQLGRNVWNIQARELKKAPWTRENAVSGKTISTRR